MEEKSMSESNRALMRRWFAEVWNNGSTDAVNEMMHEDGIAHGLSGKDGNPIIGPEGFRAFHAQFRGAFPDIKVNVDDMICEGDKVAARCSVSATHSGDTLGFAASNKPIDITGITIIRVKDGKII